MNLIYFKTEFTNSQFYIFTIYKVDLTQNCTSRRPSGIGKAQLVRATES